MMKKIGNFKYILFLFLILFMTGCKADYSAVINSDGTVSEKITLYEDNDTINTINKNNKEFISNYISLYSLDSKLVDYTMKPVFKEGYSGAEITREYKTYSDYFNNSYFLKEGYSKVNYQENSNNISIESNYFSGYSYFYRDINGREGLEDITSNFQIAYQVIENNADEVNKEQNIFTWKYNKDKESSPINLKFNNQKSFDITKNTSSGIKGNYIVLGLYAAAIIGLIAVVMFLNIRNNKI